MKTMFSFLLAGLGIVLLTQGITTLLIGHLLPWWATGGFIGLWIVYAVAISIIYMKRPEATEQDQPSK